MDKNKHKLYMAQILGLIFKDKDLCNVIALKGPTSLMIFHKLTIISRNLNINFLQLNNLSTVSDF